MKLERGVVKRSLVLWFEKQGGRMMPLCGLDNWFDGHDVLGQLCYTSRRCWILAWWFGHTHDDINFLRGWQQKMRGSLWTKKNSSAYTSHARGQPEPLRCAFSSLQYHLVNNGCGSWRKHFSFWPNSLVHSFPRYFIHFCFIMIDACVLRRSDPNDRERRIQPEKFRLSVVTINKKMRNTVEEYIRQNRTIFFPRWFLLVSLQKNDMCTLPY